MLEKMGNDFVHQECPFSIESFELIEQWSSSLFLFQTEDELIKNEDFQNYVVLPFKNLWPNIIARLPSDVTAILSKLVFFNEECSELKETITWVKRSDGYSRRSQNFYWAGLCSKDAVKNYHSSWAYSCPQLFISIREDLLDFGFYIGDRSNGDVLKQFFDNCERHQKEIISILGNSLQQEKLIYGFWTEIGKSNYTWEDFINHPKKVGECTIVDYKVVIYAAYHLKREEVLKSKKEDLINRIVNIFEVVYPLLFLAISDNPIPLIEEYLSLYKKSYLLKVAEQIGIETNELNSWIQSLNRKGQIILYGPPGTGKTFIAEKLAEYLIVDSDSFSELVQFHPAYSYEDFIQGIRPQNKDGQLTYSMVPGRFLEFCKKAESRVGICVLIIDEINRANLAQVFGELMYLLEYRDKEIPLAGGNTFRIPSNVRIIGTMNTADRSVSPIDNALRRRFAFIHLPPKPEILESHYKGTNFPIDDLKYVLKYVNDRITNDNFQLGVSFFLNLDKELDKDSYIAQIRNIWKMEIVPYLKDNSFIVNEELNKLTWDEINQICQNLKKSDGYNTNV